ncbi:MAG: PilZ domain-containing protein [Bradymonadia bacterium]
MADSSSRRNRFDPFLHNVDGAEQSREPLVVQRILAALEGKEVLLAVDDGRLEVVRYQGPLTLIPEGPFSIGLGQPVSISYHRELRYAAFRSRVQSTEGGQLRLERPAQVIFWPGRESIRVDSTLGAQITLEHDGDLYPAQGLDISMGGVGVKVTGPEALGAGETLVVHLSFDQEQLQLPAHVRSVHQSGEYKRLGLEFGAASDALAVRIRHALQYGTARALHPKI